MTTPSQSPQAKGYVRTAAPISAGPIIVYIAHQFGWDLSVDQALLFVPIISAAYYTVGRALEAINPKFGYILGLPGAPAYAKDLPDEGEKVVAEVVPENPVQVQHKKVPAKKVAKKAPPKKK